MRATPDSDPEKVANPVYHLARIATALESLAETARLSHEMSIDSFAKSNELSNGLAEAVEKMLPGLSGMFGNDSEE